MHFHWTLPCQVTRTTNKEHGPANLRLSWQRCLHQALSPVTSLVSCFGMAPSITINIHHASTARHHGIPRPHPPPLLASSAARALSPVPRPLQDMEQLPCAPERHRARNPAACPTPHARLGRQRLGRRHLLHHRDVPPSDGPRSPINPCRHREPEPSRRPRQPSRILARSPQSSSRLCHRIAATSCPLGSPSTTKQASTANSTPALSQARRLEQSDPEIGPVPPQPSPRLPCLPLPGARHPRASPPRANRQRGPKTSAWGHQRPAPWARQGCLRR